jgi:CBS domain-containing protein
MKVKDIMTKDVSICTPETTVAEAAHLMWEADCGILPVVDDGELEGVVTDRDMYIALATRNARADHLRVGAVATRTVVTCTPEDDIHAVLALMREARVRRIPIVGFGNTLLGIVSLNDIALAAGPGKALTSDEVVETLQSICGHHHPAPHVVAA